MNDHGEFLAAICARPDDYGPRLVYADWLEEHSGFDEVPCPGCAEYHHDPKNPFGWHLAGYRPERDPASGRHEGGWSNCKQCNGGGNVNAVRPGVVRLSNGNAERAEFIRVQCEIARTEVYPGERFCAKANIRLPSAHGRLAKGVEDCYECGPCTLRRRQRELIRDDAVTKQINTKGVLSAPPGFQVFGWDDDCVCYTAGRDGEIIDATFRGGFVEEITMTWANWNGGDGTYICEKCGQRGPHLDSMRGRRCSDCGSEFVAKFRGHADAIRTVTPLRYVRLLTWPDLEWRDFRVGPYHDRAEAVLSALNRTWAGITFELPNKF